MAWTQASQWQTHTTCSISRCRRYRFFPSPDGFGAVVAGADVSIASGDSAREIRRMGKTYYLIAYGHSTYWCGNARKWRKGSVDGRRHPVIDCKYWRRRRWNWRCLCRCAVERVWAKRNGKIDSIERPMISIHCSVFGGNCDQFPHIYTNKIVENRNKHTL